MISLIFFGIVTVVIGIYGAKFINKIRGIEK